jgi:hypothetical protein
MWVLQLQSPQPHRLQHGSTTNAYTDTVQANKRLSEQTMIRTFRELSFAKFPYEISISRYAA